MIEHRCRTCRYWHHKGGSSTKGDCRAPDNHRYWRVPMGDTMALMDSFGPEVTKADDGCAAWSERKETA